ncbi:MAG: serine hydrolase domain-containing protein [Cytophagales bacterium]|nr:serine hydrolase domain-containing protein [Cytophagales bacterium]
MARNPNRSMSGAYDFAPLHSAMQRYVDQDILPGVSSAVLVGREVVDLHCAGFADKEQGTSLRTDHLFRIFSNTKLVTSIAVLLLFEEGQFQLDDPIERWIPELGKRQVLRAGATVLTDTELANGSITIGHLLTHSSGLSYGLLDDGTMMFKAYTERKLLHPAKTLAEKMHTLAELPLRFEPGTNWEYSVASDVLARLIEVVSGQSFDAFLRSRIFEPLGMADTGFVIPASEQHRLAALYTGADVLDPMKSGLTRNERLPFPNANLQAVPFLSGGGGLVSSLPDMVSLIQSLLPGGGQILKPETVDMMMRNHLPSGIPIGFPTVGVVSGKGFGLGGSVTHTPSSLEPAGAVGEFQWGGMAGTHWWISPKANLAGIVMTQRWMGFWHPFSFEFKRLIYRAAQ